MTEADHPIDRAAVVRRHSPRLRRPEPRWPLQVGNGRFAVAVDATGLQTYPEEYPHHYLGATGTLLGTMAEWAWHSIPAPRQYALSETLRRYETPRGPRDYVDLRRDTGSGGHVLGDEIEEWLRNNPHKLQLAQIGFVTDVPLGSLTDLDAELDLWSGVLSSRFRAPGREPAEVVTAVHPERDALGVTSTSGWPVVLRFPYGSSSWALAGDWDRPEAHRTELEPPAAGSSWWRIDRRLDDDHHVLWVATNGRVRSAGPHAVRIEPTVEEPLWFVVEAMPDGDPASPLSAVEVLAASADGWESFWRSGAALDLDGTDDPRAHELERRVVLSQYVTRVGGTGSMPPAETGLLTSSWRGKAHLEMHWWHAAHLALWGRPELLEPSLDWYASIADGARETAAAQGYRGARWPKQVGPEGRESPSDIGTFLLWQQPHLIHLAELAVRAHRDAGRPEQADALQRRWAPLVRLTADFMADVAEPLSGGRFGLGPPLVPAQESYGADRARMTNPGFELAYWRWALLVAARWQRDLGADVPPSWAEVADGMLAPHVRDGVLTAVDVEPFTVRTDHPSMLAAHGVVPPVGLTSPDVVRATLHDVLQDWDWDTTWGWDYPMIAMTATRLQDPETAVDALLLAAAKNEHGPNGHNRQDDRLPAYLPGNGGLLAAVALMVAGWDGGPARPGIPTGWTLHAEGFVPAPGPLEGLPPA